MRPAWFTFALPLAAALPQYSDRNSGSNEFSDGTKLILDSTRDSEVFSDDTGRPSDRNSGSNEFRNVTGHTAWTEHYSQVNTSGKSLGPKPQPLLQDDLSKFAQPRIMTVSALPSAHSEKERLKVSRYWADFQPTGFYLNPLEPITIEVSGLGGNESIFEILLGTLSLIDPNDPNTDKSARLLPAPWLRDGRQTLKFARGGILYIRYVYKPNEREQVPPPVTVTFGDGPAAVPFPFYRPGVTTEAEWLDMLRVTKVPFAEHAGERVILTGLAAEALKFAEEGRDQVQLLESYTYIMAVQDDISGLDAIAPDPRDRPSPLRIMVVQGNKQEFANAANYRVAIGGNTTSDIWAQRTLHRS
ncbi:peptidase m60, enhancin and enhancin-like domain-containing protein [Hirsutella rhossiliensis]|uniref:Peptidase m60, enhancin and enhancin-like domain-containing protein n=1 Tax=Hirsutella rhossiliensis TaxID=111463 RepID=A0A9P8SMH4_9HYPO|nr:peptidase m60, enhancin and enhancin-like domain-containing protein [Hirsutella rhossiliensis]KAH0968011.1 peptidase m60, enhancin and enhancin-like domain-containing protein [Hirsutella rhossiliensis]